MPVGGRSFLRVQITATMAWLSLNILLIFLALGAFPLWRYSSGTVPRGRDALRPKESRIDVGERGTYSYRS